MTLDRGTKQRMLASAIISIVAATLIISGVFIRFHEEEPEFQETIVDNEGVIENNSKLYLNSRPSQTSFENYNQNSISITQEVDPYRMKLYHTNIVTAEPCYDGRLRVWGYNETTGGYENIWSTESVHYQSVAIGDMDNDGNREVIATTWCKCLKGKDKSQTTGCEIFFDVYKEDFNGVWISSESVHDDDPWDNEITIANVDGIPGNEVIMITLHWLAVYKYYEGDLIHLLSARNSFVEGKTLWLRSVTVGDIDGNGINEIFVSARDEEVETQGYLLIFQNSYLEEFDVVPIDAHLGDQALRVGDLDGDGYLEICATGYRIKEGNLYETYLFVWKWMHNEHGDQEWKPVVEKSMLVSKDWPWDHLDIGELNSNHLGKEIVVGSAQHPEHDLLIIYELTQTIDGYTLEEVMSRTLDYDISSINHVNIADSDNDGNNEVIVSGFWRSTEKNYKQYGHFHLEIFDHSIDVCEWKRLGGGKGEFEVWYAAVG